MTAPLVCGFDGCNLPGRPYPSGPWCDTYHAPWLFAEGRNPHPAPGRYCAPLRCYCGACPSWRPMTDVRPVPAADVLVMVEERRRLAAKVETDLGPARARAARERSRRRA